MIPGGADRSCRFQDRGAIKIFNTSNWQVTSLAAEANRRYYSVAFLANGTKLAAGRDDGKFEIFDVSSQSRILTGQIGTSTTRVQEMAWNESTGELAVGGNTGQLYIFRPFAPVDEAAPLISLSSPEDQSSTDQSSVLVSGRVTDDTGVAVLTLNGITITTDSSGYFSFNQSLDLGTNALLFAASDSSPKANTSEVLRTVTRISSPLLTIKSGGTGSGSVTSSPAGISCPTDCTQTYPLGSSVSLTAHPEADSIFEGWSGACLGKSDCVVLMGTERSVTAAFGEVTGDMVRDFNGDGMTDILWRNTSTGRNAVWYMNGTTRKGYGLLQSVSDLNWQLVGTGDWNGDGKWDLLWRNPSTGQNAIWYMDGLSRLSYAFVREVADPNWEIVSVGDFDGDTHADDIVWRNAANGQNAIWFMNNATRSSYALVREVTDLSWKIVGSGDFDDNGTEDLVWRRDGGGEIAIWYMSGATRTGYGFAPPLADDTWQIRAVADYNGDNRPDLAWRNTSTGANACWYMIDTTRTGSAYFRSLADLSWKIEGPR